MADVISGDRCLMRTKLTLLDTTLRDGEQREGVTLNLEDKLRIARRLDDLGIDFIEAGFPASNERDKTLIEQLAAEGLKNSTLVAFGMTRRKFCNVEEDPGFQTLASSSAPVISVVGKASASQVRNVLETTPEENLAMVADSIAFLTASGKRVFFDAEHYFDAFLEDRDYALQSLEAAWRAGAEVLVLCETNGGILPQQVYQICRETLESLERILGADAAPLAQEGNGNKDDNQKADNRREILLGIHCHNDCGCAVANSLEAVRAGVYNVQGCINGYGERVGNADILTILADLQLKMGFDMVSKEQLATLTEVSHYVAEIMNVSPDSHHPFVGANAFSHKGGMHSSAVMRHKPAYEHVEPELVGNFSRIVVSELAGRAALAAKARELGVSLPEDPTELDELLSDIKKHEAEGYSYEVADASLTLFIARRSFLIEECFKLESFRVISEKHARDQDETISEATIKIWVKGERRMAIGEGNGPVNALDAALRLAITSFYPEVSDFELADYKVRVLDDSTGTSAITRVLIETSDGSHSWGTVGVSENIIEASWYALVDSITYGLLRKSGGFK